MALGVYLRNPDFDGATATDRGVLVIQEFKDFINKGGIFEAAVGLIMALAFVPVVGSLVDDMIMPIVARIFSQPDFSELTIGLGGSEEVVLDDGTIVMQEAAIRYGAFINEIIAFVVGVGLLFLTWKFFAWFSGHSGLLRLLACNTFAGALLIWICLIRLLRRAGHVVPSA